MSEQNSTVYVATKTAFVNFGPGRTKIAKGITRVAAGHPLIEQYPDFFKPADQDVRFGVEDATDRPPAPETRTSPTPDVPHGNGEGSGEGNGEGDAAEAYTGPEWKKADLEAEVERRNDARGDEDRQVEVGGTGKVDDLRAALIADDEAQAEATGADGS